MHLQDGLQCCESRDCQVPWAHSEGRCRPCAPLARVILGHHNQRWVAPSSSGVSPNTLYAWETPTLHGALPRQSGASTTPLHRFGGELQSCPWRSQSDSRGWIGWDGQCCFLEMEEPWRSIPRFLQDPTYLMEVDSTHGSKLVVFWWGLEPWIAEHVFDANSVNFFSFLMEGSTFSLCRCFTRELQDGRPHKF